MLLNNLKLKKIISILNTNNLFNKFICCIFNYQEKELNNLVIRYKLNKEFIVDVFSYNSTNKFIRYQFIDENNDICIVQHESNNIYINKIYIEKCYQESKKDNNIILFASLYKENNPKKVESILNKIFCNEIKNIFNNFL